MNILPPLPETWDGFHPLIVHFPIALLAVVPLFVILAALLREKGRSFGIAALILMVLGTGAAFLATSSGEAAGEIADAMAGMKPHLEAHEEPAELSRNLFAFLTGVYLVILVAPKLFGRGVTPKIRSILHLIYLVPYAITLLVLMTAAHRGGLLVHLYGVHAPLSDFPAATVPDDRQED